MGNFNTKQNRASSTILIVKLETEALAYSKNWSSITSKYLLEAAMGTRIGIFTTLLLSVCTSIYSLSASSQDCTSLAWDADAVYERGDLASHNDAEWRAKRSTQGVIPGTHKPSWMHLSDCGPILPPDTDPPTLTSMEIFGLWHAGDHYADWQLPRDMDEFDKANNWIINKGDGTPSVNLVVLSFLQPMEVLGITNSTADAIEDGVPIGMTQDIVNYFKDAGIRVMMSIGGVTYTDFWDEALVEDAWKLGENAAVIAAHFGVGIEIDYEQNSNPNLQGLDAFINAYRSVHAYDSMGTNHAARLTIDLAAGGRYLQDLNRHATKNWFDPLNPMLDYANAMVHRASGTPAHWQEHVDGMPTYNPVIPPKAPSRFTGGLYLKGNIDNCLDFSGSEQLEHAVYVRSVSPNGAGNTNGMLGYMFWAAERPSARKNYTATIPPNGCEDGMGVAITEFDVIIPMPALRQE